MFNWKFLAYPILTGLAIAGIMGYAEIQKSGEIFTPHFYKIVIGWFLIIFTLIAGLQRIFLKLLNQLKRSNNV